MGSNLIVGAQFAGQWCSFWFLGTKVLILGWCGPSRASPARFSCFFSPACAGIPL